MRKLSNIIITICVLMSFSAKVHAQGDWNNDLRSLFLSNKATIYAINIRTFNANDKNKDGIIEENAGEERGTFRNAVSRLDELKALGINTIDLLPVTPTGKTKALGTAGSLYAPASFNEINPQLKNPNSSLTAEEEMKNFVQECHKRGLRVIVDIPCCGSYDLYLNRPELFVKDKDQNPVIPADWTDVRLLDAGTESQINPDVYGMYLDFIDMMQNMEVDGVRVNVAYIKPAAFWKKLIDDARARNPEFLFLAEASPYQSQNMQVANIQSTAFNKLMDAGFDGYYGDYSNLKNWKNASDLISHVKSDIDMHKKSASTKSVIGNFATHDQISPILVNGSQYSKMIIWLNSTLPINAFYVDGFPTGDDYIYFWANKKAPQTFTDDDYYFVHRGQLDIFNFSRKPAGKRMDVLQDFSLANKFRNATGEILSKGEFKPHRTNFSSVFAYTVESGKNIILVIGNLDFKKPQKTVLNIPKLSNSDISIPIKISAEPPLITKGKVESILTPGEIQVIFFTSIDK